LMMNDDVLRKCRFRWRRFVVVQTNSVPKATRPNAYVKPGLVATDPSAPFPFFLLEVEEADAPLEVPVPGEFPLPGVEVGLAAVVGAGVVPAGLTSNVELCASIWVVLVGLTNESV